MPLTWRWRRLSILHKCAISTITFTIFAVSVNLIAKYNAREQVVHTAGLIEYFNRATLKTLDTRKEFKADKLWLNNPVVILAIRRAG